MDVGALLAGRLDLRIIETRQQGGSEGTKHNACSQVQICRDYAATDTRDKLRVFQDKVSADHVITRFAFLAGHSGNPMLPILKTRCSAHS